MITKIKNKPFIKGRFKLESKKGDDHMVPWWGLPLAMFFGVAVGIVLIALISANENDEE